MIVLEFKNISLLIIAGGKSTRLGQDKRLVKVGGVSLLESILIKASSQGFAEIFLCVEEELTELKILADKFGAKLLVDMIKDSGPMAGLANGLARIKTDWALAVSTDMPFLNFNALRPLVKNLSSAQAIIPVVGGWRQMLAAFYRRELAEVFMNELIHGQRKIFTAIKKVPHELVEPSIDTAIFFNVNTPADLRLARGRAENLSRKTPIVSIVAPKSGTGKTKFIEQLLNTFSAQGIRVGVIKSDSHGFNIDVIGKDSHRFQTAGARSVAVVSAQGWFIIQRTDERENFFAVADKMTVDLILTESRTHGTFPTISLWRGLGEVIADEKVAAIFTSEPVASDKIIQHDLNDFDAAEKICKFLAGYSILQTSRPQFSH